METPTRRRIGAGIGFLVLVVAGGSGWYWHFEDFTPVEAVYQTVITISTVGFGEIREISETGRIVTMAVILLGAGTTAYTLTALFEHFAEERLDAVRRRRMEREAKRMIDHMIVCGYGQVGRRIAEEGTKHGDVVVVDQDPERTREATEHGLNVVLGDPSADETLEKAGIAEAAVLVVTLSSDAENLYIAMSARALNPGLRIVGRAQTERAAANLTRAGANRVVNLEALGAGRMFAFATRPTVSEFLDAVLHRADVEFELDESVIGRESNVASKTVGEADLRRATGAVVLAVRREDGTYTTIPDDDTVLEPGQTLIALGDRRQLRQLRRVLDPEGVYDQEMRQGIWPHV